MPDPIYDLYHGLKELLVGLGVAGLPRAIFFPLEMQPTPDSAIVITPVPMTDNNAIPIGVVMVQFKYRGEQNSPFSPHTLASLVHPNLENLKDFQCGSVHIIQMYRTVSIPATQDDKKRWTRIDQYYLDVDYPATPLRNQSGY